MKSFEGHLRGAKAHNREDKIWLVTCFSGKMAKLCAKYGFPDDEDMFVYLIEHFMRLKTDEAIAIRWHMGGFDDAVRGGSYAISDAYNRYPLAVKLHVSDLIATYLLEQGTSAVENGH